MGRPHSGAGTRAHLFGTVLTYRRVTGGVASIKCLGSHCVCTVCIDFGKRYTTCCGYSNTRGDLFSRHSSPRVRRRCLRRVCWRSWNRKRVDVGAFMCRAHPLQSRYWARGMLGLCLAVRRQQWNWGQATTRFLACALFDTLIRSVPISRAHFAPQLQED